MKKQHGRSSGALAPVVTGEMSIDLNSDPVLADFQWRTTVPIDRPTPVPIDGTPLEVTCDLTEEGELILFASIGTGNRGVTFIDGEHCKRRELVALARALTAVAARVEAEQKVAHQTLMEWRRRYTEALGPIDLAASAT